MLQAPVRPVPKEHLAVIHPMQYELERTYHSYCQQAAAQRREAAEAERHSAAHASFARVAESVATKLLWELGRRIRALAAQRSQVA
jgi:hypothetical protein